MKFMGNHSEPYEMTLAHGDGARFEVLTMKSPEDLKAGAQGDARVRSQQRLDDNATLLDWLNIKCKGMTLLAAAAEYGASEGISESAAKQRIRRAGIRKAGNDWVFRASGL